MEQAKELLPNCAEEDLPITRTMDDYARELNAARQSAVTSEIAEIIGALDVIGAQDGGHK